MAGDWIKVRDTLPDDPRVIRLAELLGEEDPDLIVGKLVRLWIYADTHTVDGTLPLMTARTVDRLLGYPGFADKLCSIGWLEFIPGSCVIVRFGEHNGESAKRRAQENRRKARSRAVSDAADTGPQGKDNRQGGRDVSRTGRGQAADVLRPKRREDIPPTPKGVSSSQPPEKKGRGAARGSGTLAQALRGAGPPQADDSQPGQGRPEEGGLDGGDGQGAGPGGAGREGAAGGPPEVQPGDSGGGAPPGPD